MHKLAIALGAAVAMTAFAGLPAEAKKPTIPHLDHVFLIVMENHGFGQIIGNPNAPFINFYAQSANLATNYFAVGHPSLTT